MAREMAVDALVGFVKPEVRSPVMKGLSFSS
jgi:hypothetical protein